MEGWDDTVPAMRSGAWLALVGGVREAVRRFRLQAGRRLPVVLTGGGAETIADALGFVPERVPDLLWRGLAAFGAAVAEKAQRTRRK
jgi:pantothenate kinase type III